MSLIDELRGPKIANFVIFDWVSTIISAIIIQQVFDANVFMVFIILIILSIFLHIIFKVDTQTNYLLGLSQKPDRSNVAN